MSPLNKPILLVEDREDDVVFFKSALKHAHLENPIYVVQKGQDALDYLAGESQFSSRTRCPFPSVLMLDLYLPDISGFEVLQRVRANFDRNRLLVVILTAADELPTIRRAYALGADSFIVKPPRPEDFLNLATGFCFHWGTVGDLIGPQAEARAVSGT